MSDGKLSAQAKHALLDVNAAINAHVAAEQDAVGYAYGKRAYNLRAAEKRLRALLWEKRFDLQKLIREANP